jgi:hypothetical protein
VAGEQDAQPAPDDEAPDDAAQVDEAQPAE